MVDARHVHKVVGPCERDATGRSEALVRPVKPLAPSVLAVATVPAPPWTTAGRPPYSPQGTVRAEVGEGGVAVDGHDQVGLGEEGAEDVDDAVRTAEGEPVRVRAADAHGRGAEGEGLDDIGTGADTGVEEHREAVGGGDHVGQGVEGGQPAVGLTAAVVGAVDAVDTAVPGAADVLGVADALEDDGEIGE